MKGRAIVLGALAAIGAGVVAGTASGASSVKGNISIAGIWTGAEQQSFQAVLKAGNPPDLAAVGQPGLAKQFAQQGKLKPITFARAAIARNYAPDWVKLGTVNGKLYGLFFKGANKSTVWYSAAAFKQAGVKP